MCTGFDANLIGGCSLQLNYNFLQNKVTAFQLLDLKPFCSRSRDIELKSLFRKHF